MLQFLHDIEYLGEDGIPGGKSLLKEATTVRVAILDDYQGVAAEMADWSQLPDGTELQIFREHFADENAVAKGLQEFHVIMGMRERTPFPRSLLSRLPELRLLVTTGPVSASFDVRAATEMGIVVSATNNAGEGPTELTWALILSLTKKILQEDRATRQGHWGTALGIGLKGKTLGLLGLGRIGSLVALVGHAFGMNLIAWSQNLTVQRATECHARLVDKDTLFRESDIVSVHLRLSDRTRGLVAAPEFALMRATAYLINTSRGPIVDEKALIDVLQRKAIAGAGLEVFDKEPLPKDHALLELPNTLVTPHIGYVNDDSYRTFYRDVVEDIVGFVSGKPVRVLNPEVLTASQLRGPLSPLDAPIGHPG